MDVKLKEGVNPYVAAFVFLPRTTALFVYLGAHHHHSHTVGKTERLLT